MTRCPAPEHRSRHQKSTTSVWPVKATCHVAHINYTAVQNAVKPSTCRILRSTCRCVERDSARDYAAAGNRSTPKKKTATTAAIAIHHHQAIIQLLSQETENQMARRPAPERRPHSAEYTTLLRLVQSVLSTAPRFCPIGAIDASPGLLGIRRSFPDPNAISGRFSGQVRGTFDHHGQPKREIRSALNRRRKVGCLEDLGIMGGG